MEGTLSLKAHGRAVFTCLTPGMPALSKGSMLLLIPDKEPQILLVQASVDMVVDQSVLLMNVDPRRRARYRTRVTVSFYGAMQAAYDHLKNHTARAFRQEEAAKDKSGKSYVAKILDRVEDYAKTSHDAVPYIGKGKVPLPAMMSDISEGGCCLHVPKDLPIDDVTATRLILVVMEVPHASRKIEARIFASVRSVRNAGESRILHCMFVEPLPVGVLDF
jgi:hypothetical protein